MNDDIKQEKMKHEMMRGILTIKSKTFLSPHYISVVLEGEDLKNFKNAEIGDNNKLLVPVKGSKKVIFPITGVPQDETAVTVMRTYTLRNLDLEKQEMTIEFVAHGEEGPASAWAISSEIGDQLGVMMKKKDKKIFQPADWYLFAGDHTALPVISVLLESMQENAIGEALIEVRGAEDMIELKHPAGVNVVWLFNATPGIGSALPELFRWAKIPSQGTRFIFAAAESRAITEIQDFLKTLPALSRNEWKAYSYWKLGQSAHE
ncbi:siderophore-interacting protein [Pedobacter sp. N36a]|uniref:siderophore-interacting protein n=1 Tax=Pedobacter sp. N36a TaxID=2767996 RepID=UPI001656D2B2|nr:siderophore-interacting protein [Pedobacter sp. N36a]MBC8986333.1 siderophore-interacting protein [Pedobacter sp. N36a]